ncbi:MAG: polymer-forming cytoskeletal protein, partial [Xanthomonadaceae bacterium]|nr:polymer-forming cytoskeletal protein [Xanthomonadaceae bacterium]
MFKKQSNQHIDVSPETLIGPRTTIDGNVSFSGGLCVEGRVNGEIRALNEGPATLILSEHGHVEGKIFAPVVRVSGEL